MKRICTQCGNEFELTENEIEFYESRGLILPKRCKSCRKSKKSKSKSKNGGTANQQEKDSPSTDAAEQPKKIESAPIPEETLSASERAVLSRRVARQVDRFEMPIELAAVAEAADITAENATSSEESADTTGATDAPKPEKAYRGKHVRVDPDAPMDPEDCGIGRPQALLITVVMFVFVAVAIILWLAGVLR